MGGYLSTPVDTIVPKSASIGINTEEVTEVTEQVTEQVKEQVTEVAKVNDMEELDIVHVEKAQNVEAVEPVIETHKVEVEPVEVSNTDVVKRKKKKKKRASPTMCECGVCGFCKNTKSNLK